MTRIIEINLSVSFMVCIVIFIRKVFLKKMPHITFLWLWVLIVCKLILPISIDTPYSIFNLPIFYEKSPIQKNEIDIDSILHHIDVVYDTANHKHLYMVLFCVWLFGFMLIASHFLIQYQGAKKEILQSYAISDDAILQTYKKQLQLPDNIIFLQNDFFQTPAVWGIKNPKIIFPNNISFENAMDWQYVLLHEYGHIRYHHALVKIICMFLLALYWYNPFVWISYIEIDKDMEIMADRYVLKQFLVDNRKSYATCLLHAIKANNHHSVFYYHYKKNFIKERIEMIMRFKKLTISSIFILIMTLLSVATVFATTDIQLTSAELSKLDITITVPDENDMSDIPVVAADDVHNIFIEQSAIEKYIEHVDDKAAKSFSIKKYPYSTYQKLPPKTLNVTLERNHNMYSGSLNREYYVYDDKQDKYTGFYSGKVYLE